MSPFNITCEKVDTKLSSQRDSPNFFLPFQGYIDLMNDDVPNRSQLVAMVLLISQLDRLTANQITQLKSIFIRKHLQRKQKHFSPSECWHVELMEIDKKVSCPAPLNSSCTQNSFPVSLLFASFNLQPQPAQRWAVQQICDFRSYKFAGKIPKFIVRPCLPPYD